MPRKSKYNNKYSKFRNMDIEIANESLLKRMVKIVNRKNQYIYVNKPKLNSLVVMNEEDLGQLQQIQEVTTP